jgi:cytochrome c553
MAAAGIDFRAHVDLPRKPYSKPARRGENAPSCGRKFCSTCGRWRLLVDFHVHTRTNNDVPCIWQARCSTCHRMAVRVREGRKPRTKMSPEQKRVHDLKMQAKRRRDPVMGEKRREYERMYLERRRRMAGIPERPIGPKSRKIDAPGSDLRRVPVGPVLEACEGVGSSELARRMGWYSMGKPDERRLARTIGRARDSDGRYRTGITIRNAILVAKALGVPPYTVGV